MLTKFRFQAASETLKIWHDYGASIPTGHSEWGEVAVEKNSLSLSLPFSTISIPLGSAITVLMLIYNNDR